jgi:hypothetical protein
MGSKNRRRRYLFDGLVESHVRLSIELQQPPLSGQSLAFDLRDTADEVVIFGTGFASRFNALSIARILSAGMDILLLQSPL